MVQPLSSSGDATPDNFIGFTIVRLAHVLQLRMDRALIREVGISVRQFGALSYLARDPGLGSAALARKLLITAQSAGPLVDDLQRRGLVDRNDHVQAGVKKAIKLTPHGNDVLRLGYRVAERLRAEDEADLRPEALEVLHSSLMSMLERLSEPQDDTSH